MRNVNGLKRFMKKNASTILTCVGAAGVAITTVSAVKATIKAVDIVENVKEVKGEELTKMEVFKAVAPTYIPTVLFGASTIACIFGANVLNTRSQAALMSAYALLDNSYKDYKAKVEEVYGEGSNAYIREEIAKDKYEEEEIPAVDDSKELYFDYFSSRYFESTPKDVLLAQYEVNRILHLDGCIDLNEYYQLLGLPHDAAYDELGWSIGQLHDMYWEQWIEFSHEKTELEDGLECTIVNIEQEPFLGYLEY